MNIASFLATISAVVLLLHVAARIPAAIAELLRACAPILDAWAALRHARNESNATSCRRADIEP